MEIKFSIDAAALNKALDITSIVTPRQVTPKGDTGYLFVVRGQECHIYSRDQSEMAKTVVPITEVSGEGPFVIPGNISGFRHLEGTVNFTATSENDTYVVRYVGTGGAAAEKGVFDPRLIPPFDKDYQEATEEKDFPAGILREAIMQSRSFVAGDDKKEGGGSEEHFKTVQIFDESRPEWAKGKCHLYAANSTIAFFFYCPAFDKGLAIHSKHLPQVISFLSKITGKVSFKTGKNCTFVSDDAGNVLGWPHHDKVHGKFSYYAMKMDKNVFSLSRDAMLRSLRFTKTEMDKNRDKVKLSWINEKSRFEIHMVDASSKIDGYPIPVEIVESEGQDFHCNVNIDHMIRLFEGLKNAKAQLRVCILPPDANRPKGAAFIRTIDDFHLDAEGKEVIAGPENMPEGVFACRVTRIMPSKD